MSVTKAAYGRDAESHLAARLVIDVPGTMAVLGEEESAIVGVVLFSPVSIDNGAPCMAIGPMAVHPERQRRGIGSKLLRKGLMDLRFTECPLVVAIGPSAFFARFGFRPAARLGLSSKWEIDSDAFLALALDPVKARAVSGSVRYPDAFDSFMA